MNNEAWKKKFDEMSKEALRLHLEELTIKRKELMNNMTYTELINADAYTTNFLEDNKSKQVRDEKNNGKD